jgi:tRNA modification GTPase
VTHIAGTTRDVLEERLVVDGRDFVISDTAGLRDTDDVVERMGVERSRKAIAGADLACVIVDGSQGDGAILKALEDARTELRGPTRAETLDLPLLVVVTKADLWALDVEEARRRIASLRESDLSTTRNGVDSTTWTFAGTADSLEEGDAPRNGGFRGTSEMESVLVELCDKLTATPEANAPTTLISTRQRDAVVAARARVVEAVEVLSSGGYPEAAASLLLAANRALVEVVGDISAEDVLGSIFSTFCIGK